MTNRLHHHAAATWARSSSLRPYIAYLFLANVAFWLAGSVFDTLPRAAFNLDYVLIAAIVPLVGLRFGIGLMSLAVFADVWRSCASLYYFNASDALGSLAFISELSPFVLAAYAIVISVFILLWSATVVLFGDTQLRRPQVAPFAVITVVLASVAVFGGNTSLRLTDRTETANVASSAGLSLVKSAWSAMSSRTTPVAVHEIDSATRRAGWFAHPPKDRHLVLIVVESWGMPKDASWLDAVTEPLYESSVLARYRVESGSVPFHGPTVPAEFRELCGLSSAVVQRPTDEKLLANCLPAQARLRGETTLYLHPFDGFMFYRRQWVPGLGFDSVLFRRELLDAGVKKCDGPFAGACDDDAIRWLGDRLNSPQAPGFIFLLTLNSHLPVTMPKNGGNPLLCGTEQRLTGDESICELLTLIRQVHAATAQIAVRNDLPPTEFLLVGDHAPPFLYKWRRERFSQAEVPYIHLIPRTPAHE